MLSVLIGLAAYGLLHSYLAGRGKSWFQQVFSERTYHGLYRIIYNVIAIISILPILYLVAWQSGEVVWTIPLEWEPVLFAIQLVGIVGFAVSLLQIDLLRFAGLKQLYVYVSGGSLPLSSEQLQTGGMYAVVRHPLYLFSLLLLWPVTTMTSAYLGFCIGVTVYFFIGSFYEERRMVEHYGKTYQAYQKRVPWLIPFLNIRKQSERKV